MDVLDVVALAFFIPLVVLVWTVAGSIVLWGLGAMFPERFGDVGERARDLWNS